MWVARDKDRTLWFFSKFPHQSGIAYYVQDNIFGYSSKIDQDLFPDLKYEDGPIEVEVISSKILFSMKKKIDDYEQQIAKLENKLNTINFINDQFDKI